MIHRLVYLAAALTMLSMAGCATTPPSNTSDACEIFREKGDWYEAMRESRETWGVPISVQLAILHQESRFRHDAKPPRRKLLWIIPWTRESSAYGYAQVKDSTWQWYQDDTGNGWADRDDLEDVADFVGWYATKSHRMCGIAKSDAYNQYLAYHEGQGGFNRGTYRNKPQIQQVARRVADNARHYRGQLARCEDELKGPWWWPF